MFLDSGLNCVYVVSGTEASLIPDEEDLSGLEFKAVTSLVCDDLGNMIVIDTSTEKLQILDKYGKYLGSVMVGNGHPTTIFLDSRRRQLYVSFLENNTIHKYQL